MLNGGQKRKKMALRTENVENGGYEIREAVGFPYILNY
jgi:hypothetical protein